MARHRVQARVSVAEWKRVEEEEEEERRLMEAALITPDSPNRPDGKVGDRD